jgi:ABC-type cobalamin transport system permease subunit
MKRPNDFFAWALLLCGVLTTTMIRAALDPHQAMLETFGEPIGGPWSEMVVRNWGILITLMGLMLIYAAFRPEVRPLVLTVAGASKIGFIVLVLSDIRTSPAQQVLVAVCVDTFMVCIFAAYLARCWCRALANGSLMPSGKPHRERCTARQ